MLHNQGPKTRGRKREVIEDNTAAIAVYLDDPNIHQNNKGKPWQDIAKDASIKLLLVHYLKPSGWRPFGNKPIQQACKKD